MTQHDKSRLHLHTVSALQSLTVVYYTSPPSGPIHDAALKVLAASKDLVNVLMDVPIVVDP
jgi:hypothetical protein